MFREKKISYNFGHYNQGLWYTVKVCKSKNTVSSRIVGFEFELLLKLLISLIGPVTEKLIQKGK